ncbi:MAG: histidine phosphatase family protein [Bacteroidia bacterium]|nr:histidine phosphatase family protein [Bacteroidia bacterium]
MRKNKITLSVSLCFRSVASVVKRRRNILLLVVGLSVFSACNLFKQKEEPPVLSTKTLYLIRHAKSDHDSLSLSDFDRPLEQRGIDNAIAMGNFFKGKSPCIDLVILSPSARTKQTFDLICGKWLPDSVRVVKDTALYNCSKDEALQVVNKIPEKYKCVILVGHNTWITSFANSMQDEKVIDEISTAGIVAVNFEGLTWAQFGTKKGKLLFYQTPKKL